MPVRPRGPLALGVARRPGALCPLRRAGPVRRGPAPRRDGRPAPPRRPARRATPGHQRAAHDLPRADGPVAAGHRSGEGRRRRRSPGPGGTHPRPGRRERLGQVHSGPADPASGRPLGRRHRPGRRRPDAHGGPGAAAHPAVHADRVPGPVLVTRPTHARERHRGRAPGDLRPTDGRRAGRAGGRAPRAGRPGEIRPLPPPARVLRRATPTHRHRPGPRPRAPTPGVRRAGERLGRVHAVTGHQPPHRPAGPARAGLPLHRPRPVRGAPHQRPDRRDVPGPDRGGGRRRGGLSADRAIRTPRRCCRPFPSPTSTDRRAPSASSSPARWPTPSIRPRDARSTPGARTPWRSARRWNLRPSPPRWGPPSAATSTPVVPSSTGHR